MLKDEILKKLKAVSITDENQPFPYFFVDDLLPEKTLKRLQDESLKYMPEFQGSIHHGGRKMLMNTTRHYDTLMNRSAEWHEFDEALNSKEVFEQVLDRFAGLDPSSIELQRIFGPPKSSLFKKLDEIGDVSVRRSRLLKILAFKFYFGLRYLKEKLLVFWNEKIKGKKTAQLLFDISLSKKNYTREIHRDSDNRLIVFLFYLSELPASEKGGKLGLYDIKADSPSWQIRDPRPKDEDCEQYETISPKANRLVMFLNTEKSFHGVEKLMDDSSVRLFCYGSYTLLGQPYFHYDNKLKTEFHLYR